jgi:hypothetical protein
MASFPVSRTGFRGLVRWETLSTVEINIAEGEPGLEEDNPIEIEGDEEEEPPIDPPPAGPKEASDLELAVMAAIEVRIAIDNIRHF